jgi:hypothetical protein
LVIFNKEDQFTRICQLNVSRGQDSMSGIVLTDICRSFLRISKVTEKIKTSSKPTPSENFTCRNRRQKSTTFEITKNGIISPKVGAICIKSSPGNARSSFGKE